MDEKGIELLQKMRKCRSDYINTIDRLNRCIKELDPMDAPAIFTIIPMHLEPWVPSKSLENNLRKIFGDEWVDDPSWNDRDKEI